MPRELSDKVTNTSPPDKGDALFHTHAWQQVLENGLNATSVYLEFSETQISLAISVFKVGPFRIGYVGFPVGGALANRTIEYASLITELRDHLKSDLACLRIPQSAFVGGERLSLPHVTTPETAITGLQSWDLTRASNNIRRDIKKAKKSGLTIRSAQDSADGNAVYDLYSATISRAGGSLRYSKNYFCELVKLARDTDRILFSLAELDGQIAGFNVAAVDNNIAYYLHGGINIELKSCRPASLLMLTAIEWGQNSLADVFNFMSSPPNQKSLVEYKEKWGGETLTHHTYQLGLGRWRRSFEFADNCRRLVQKISA